MGSMSVYVKFMAGILEKCSFEYYKDVKILFFHMFSETSKLEVLLLCLFIWKHLIAIASEQKTLYNQRQEQKIESP